MLSILLAAIAVQPAEVRRLLESGPDGSALVRFAVAADVCATATSLRIGSGSDGGTWWFSGDGDQAGPCEKGPLGVSFTRRGGKLTSIRPALATRPGQVLDLGLVSAPGVARAFLEIALEADGRLGREALLAAILADSANLGPALLAIAGRGDRSRALREAAIGWVGVAFARAGDPAAAEEGLGRLAANPDLPESVRARSLNVLARGGGNLVGLRRLWPSLTSSALRQAAVDALGEAGGPENARWLLAIVADTTVPVRDRARAVRATERAGTGSAELARLYQGQSERPVRAALLETLGRIADRAALDAIRAIAERDTDPELRRAAVRRLADSGGADDREALRQLIER